ncbi:energy-coupling factor transporter ATPase [Kroppenstedtia eburnea]|uniref:Energy-coupling factor transport system ATP-binding protein n=1 Tax=Kroppenstedtia eburnea TaxID=714067 RepID=A0A1N7N1I9_9BACL|nr:energy-coupling factor transporter ATPase [Kroppenstedtia eburnea]EGK09774.1 cobalt ABC superfamily ATP binding cassette transporter, ABC protein [Desmospora sp. 8437]QKI80787.1 energy-coupling factor transporter ATPase [Kroppenstedtia eburnea]SIS92220.1 energy-coupling factor transport system ATP-binding protein [Kroppenstedtia eburnea]
MEPILQLDGVGFHYGSPGDGIDPEWILSGLNLRVDPGEYLAVMGPNGSGKSTLAKLMNGLLTPVVGEVRVGGLDPGSDRDLPQIRRKVGMVFQNPDNQIVGTTVKDDVAFGMENLGVPREQMLIRIRQVLARTGLTGLEEASPHHLSGGQKQRLAIAGVIAMQPEVIIFDEATSMLDPSGRREVLEVMGELHRGGTTIIHITHSPREASRAERVLVLAGGEPQWDGPPAELFRERERLADWSLEMPIAAELKERLRRHGMPLREEITGMEELVEELWTLLSKT